MPAGSGSAVLGNLIADAILWATREQGTRIAIQNVGGIRSGIPAGQVTMGQVVEVLPFSNTIATFDGTGADLVALWKAASAASMTRPRPGRGVPRRRGLRYVFDPAKPEGARISSIEVRTAGGAFQPVNPSATYKAATGPFVLMYSANTISRLGP